VDPVKLVVTALTAGAAKGAGETATAVVKDAYASLKTAVLARMHGQVMAQEIVAEHAADPETYEKPLAKKIQETGAATDPRIVQLAQELMRLIDLDGATTGKYRVDIRDAKGVQVGDHNTQTNTFS